jgi:glycosyltransferase
MAGQSWPYREHVVIDGASSDGTVELLEARRDSLSVLISEADRGIYDALNKGLIYARGDVVGFLHADDVYASPDTLSRVAQEFANPAVGAVYGDLRYVWKDRPDRFVRYWHSRPYTVNLLRRGWMPPHPTLYVRREWYERVGSFDTRYRISADYDHIVRLFSQSDLNPVYIPEVLVHMRTGGASNRSFGAIARKSCEDLNILRHHGVGGLGTLALKNLSKLGQFRYGFP